MFLRDFFSARINFFFKQIKVTFCFLSPFKNRIERYFSSTSRPCINFWSPDFVPASKRCNFFFPRNSISTGSMRFCWFQWSMKGKKLSTLNDNKREIGEIKKKKQELYLNYINPSIYTLKSLLIEASRWHANARGTAYRNTSSFLLIERY